MNISTILGILAGLLPVLYLVFKVILHFFPEVKLYLSKGLSVLIVIEEFIETVAENFDDMPYINTVEDIVEEIIEQLRKAGVTVNEKEAKVIADTTIKELNQREGFNIGYEDGIKFNYKKVF